jgi:hypothetical protein
MFKHKKILNKIRIFLIFCQLVLLFVDLCLYHCSCCISRRTWHVFMVGAFNIQGGRPFYISTLQQTNKYFLIFNLICYCLIFVLMASGAFITHEVELSLLLCRHTLVVEVVLGGLWEIPSPPVGSCSARVCEDWSGERRELKKGGRRRVSDYVTTQRDVVGGKALQLFHWNM